MGAHPRRSASPPAAWRLGLLASLAAAGAAACEPGEPIAALQISQPLIDRPGSDDRTRIAVDAAGCVRVHYPAWDLRAGVHGFALTATQLQQLRAAIALTGASAFDRQRARSDVAAASSAPARRSEQVRVSDAETVSLSLALPGAAPVTATWTGLHESRAKLPRQVDLAALDAAAALLRAFEQDRRLAPVAAAQ